MIQIVLLRQDPKTGKNFHRHPVGFPNGISAANTDVLFSNLGVITDQLRAKDPDNLKNVYYTVAHHLGVGTETPVRDKLSYSHQTIIAFDIDSIDGTRVWDYLPIVAGILGVAQQSLIFVATGNGCHIIAHLKTPIRSNKYLEETKPHYNEIVYRINAALKQAALPGHADPSIWDAPRILRLPNSINEKRGITKEATLLQYPGLVPLDLDITKVSRLDILAAENISPAQLKKHYPKPDFAKVMSECEFMKWLVEKPDQIHEPQYQSALGIFGAMEPSDRAAYDGQDRTPKEIAGLIFDKACSSASLQGTDFEAKWEHGTRYGAPKCSTISSNWIGGCEKCPHHHKIKTPLALKSEEHISSAENGYWVHGKSGPLHPHYSDIAKLYRQRHSYVTCAPDRFFVFEGTHYTHEDPLFLKAWLEKNIGYEECLRDSHCVEFVKKIMRSNVLSHSDEVSLFDTSVRGKLNCKNGVIDIVRGELIPHGPALGFKYVLPYDYIPDQSSEFFLNWLGEMMQNRLELIDSVLDLMAYCLWPNYDDHVFGYLVGEGRNGKSTLLHIIQELLGRDNYCAVSLAQLGRNRFAPASLEGKLANLSEESSGTDLGPEEVNVIKDLSAGGEIQAENKGEKHFMLRNKAKLIFSANKTPRFHESGKAIRSRLLVIPFDHTIERPDTNVEKRLLSEVPKICSMLVKRIQENIHANDGKFKVSRGGEVALVAQDKVLLAGNSVVEWSRENIESSVGLSEDQYITCKEAYDRYKNWCEDNNHKVVNSTQFGYALSHGVLTGVSGGSSVKKIGGKSTRVYPRTQWKEEVIV